MRCFNRYNIKNAVFIILIGVFTIIVPVRADCGPRSDTRTIVIDPGHGGSDFGAKGADNTTEKEVTLSAALILKKELEKKYSVILTRADDFWVDPYKRTETANTNHADLFISIHTGAGFTRETEGISFIYHTPSPEQNSDLPTADWYSTQKKHGLLSRQLAVSLARRFSSVELYGKPMAMGLSLPLLAGADMPSLFIEIGILTNPTIEKRLKNPDYLSDFMKETAVEIDRFLKKHQNGN